MRIAANLTLKGAGSARHLWRPGFLALPLCAALFAPVLCAVAAAADKPAGRAASERFTRIVGGTEAGAEAWPWQVALMKPRTGAGNIRLPAILRRLRDRPGMGAHRRALRGR